MRSPLFYPLNRAGDTDVGGAADLQTDVMRFMAILSLCLVAIFALVQSMPLAPPEGARPQPPGPDPTPQGQTPMAEAPMVEAPMVEAPMAEASVEAPPPPAPKPVERVAENVVLTRPKWVPKYTPTPRPVVTETDASPTPAVEPEPEPVADTAPEPVVEVPPPVAEEPEGFTLRFESDAALTRLVAANMVGFYAIDTDRARRMTVSDSRISFWDASTPNSFHEMEPATVPAAVVDALSRTGASTEGVSFGVTLPGKLKGQLDELMQAHRGGELVIEAAGSIRRETGT